MFAQTPNTSGFGGGLAWKCIANTLACIFKHLKMSPQVASKTKKAKSLGLYQTEGKTGEKGKADYSFRGGERGMYLHVAISAEY